MKALRWNSAASATSLTPHSSGSDGLAPGQHLQYRAHAVGNRLQVVSAFQYQGEPALAVTVGDRLDDAGHGGEAFVAHVQGQIQAVGIEAGGHQHQIGLEVVGGRDQDFTECLEHGDIAGPAGQGYVDGGAFAESDAGFGHAGPIRDRTAPPGGYRTA